MKCQNRFSMENKKNIINLSSPKLAQRVVKVFLYGHPINMHLDFFRNRNCMHICCLLCTFINLNLYKQTI